MSLKFTKKIYVTIENQGTQDEYFNVTTESAEKALTTTDRTKVATYELVNVKEGKLEPVFNTVVG